MVASIRATAFKKSGCGSVSPASQSWLNSVGMCDPGAAAELPPAPGWLAARQRRVKTEVAMAMGQQPRATAADAAAVLTPQEALETAHPRSGKRIEGLARAGEGGGCGGKAGGWFADPGAGGGSTGEAPPPPDPERLAYWFGESGEGPLAQQHLAEWSPTKDAAIAADIRKMHAAKKGQKEEPQAPAAPPPPPPPNGAT
jgi:hypothetical protein